MRLHRISEASMSADKACQGGALGMIPPTCPRVCYWPCLLVGYGCLRGMHQAWLSCTGCTGRWAPVVFSAYELGLERIPATRESTGLSKVTIPAPSSV